jgi:outer membrane protein TolC
MNLSFIARYATGLSLAIVASTANAQDLSLQEAVATALRNNPSLQAMEAEIRASAANVSLARSRKGLALSANGFATAGNTGPIYNSPPKTDPPAYMLVPSGTSLIGNLTLMLPLYTGGTLDAGVNAAVAERQASTAEWQAIKGETTLMVHEAFLMALRASEMIEALAAKVRENEEMVRITQAQFEAGKAIEATVGRAQTELSMAQRDLTSARNEREKAVVDLRTVMGVDLEKSVEPNEEFEGTEPAGTLDDLLRNAGDRRGTILAAKARLHAAQEEVRGAEGQLKPQVYGMAMADVMNDRAMKGGASFGIVASFPVFDSGMRRSDVARMRAMRDRAQADLTNQERRVAGEIRKAWLDVTTAEANAHSAEAAVKGAEEAYKVTTIRLEAGKAIFLEQLDALQSLAEARAERAQTFYEHKLAVARLHQAAGFFDLGEVK